MFANNTVETCTGEGDTLTLLGAVSYTNEAGKTENTRPFSLAFSDGNLVQYFVTDHDGGNEVSGIGIYNSAGNAITRDDTESYNGTILDKNPASNIALSAGVHTIRCGIVSKSARSRVVTAPLFGSFFLPQSVIKWAQTGAKGGGEHSASAGAVCYTPIIMHSPQLITSVGAEISTVSVGGNFRIGLYERNSDESVGALIFDSGDISTDTLGMAFATLAAPILVGVGDYYLADVVDNTIATSQGERSTNSGASLAIASTDGTDDAYIKPKLLGTYGPFVQNPVPGNTTKWASFGGVFK